MTEQKPKYEVGTYLLTAMGSVIKVKEIDIDEEGVFYHDKWGGESRFMGNSKCHKEMNVMFQYRDCVGLGNQGCPAYENTCDNCERKCEKYVVTEGRDGIREDIDITFCSAYKRKE